MDLIHTFKQGQTFSAIIGLDTEVPAGQFDQWEIKSQLRKANNPTPAGLVSELGIYQLGPSSDNRYLIYAQDTSTWPIGYLEIDILFTHESGHKVLSRTVTIKIEPRVTRNG